MWAMQYIFFLVSEFSFVLRFEYTFFEVSQLYSYINQVFVYTLAKPISQTKLLLYCIIIIFAGAVQSTCLALALNRSLLFYMWRVLFYFQCTYLTIVSIAMIKEWVTNLPWSFFWDCNFSNSISIQVKFHFVSLMERVKNVFFAKISINHLYTLPSQYIPI